MKKGLLTLAPLVTWMTIKAQHTDYPIQPVPFTQVQVLDNFWKPKIRINKEVSIPYTFGQCQHTGRMDNFMRASGMLPPDTATTFPFDDTDLYKTIEGASYSLHTEPDPRLEAYLDTLITLIASAQEPDGYLYTFRTMHSPKPHDWIGSQRWEKDEDLSHELYNCGHLFEAAAAHYLATGKRNLLDIALKNADLLVHDFGWGKVEKFPGHQVVETGLTKLYRITGKKEYLDLAKFFLDLRGKPGHYNQEYSQSHIPVVDQHTAVGHAVRAAYMYTGMADVAALTGDKKYLTAIDDIWNDVIGRKLYITGGIGATGNGEAFGADYDLPNMSAYAETCASIANVYWNSRMFLLHGDAKYVDVLERVLYNGVLSGVSISGDRFFYPNPLASLGQHQRSAWFSCACCISNMTRFLPSMPGYVYGQNGNDLYVNLFVGSQSQVKLPVTGVSIRQSTNYPWDGRNEILIEPEKTAAFTIKVRIPGWALYKPLPGDLYQTVNKRPVAIPILINGKPYAYNMEKGYAILNRTWKKGDKISFELPMTVQKIQASSAVKADEKRLALQRGPLVYCLEGPDNADGNVMNILVEKGAVIKARFEPGLLNGVMTLRMPGWGTRLDASGQPNLLKKQEVVAIPYYAWANRGPSEMQVWIPYDASVTRPKPAPSIASKSRVSSSLGNERMNKTLNDQYDPADSKDASASYLHWWPRKNSTEWVQYDFDSVYTVSESRVYWFDDGPFGGCRIPASWTLYYLKEGEWVPVKNTTPYSVTRDQYDILRFEPVTTKALRLEVKLPADNSAGIHEWRVK